MKKVVVVFVTFLTLIIISCLVAFIAYKNSIKSVSNDKELRKFVVENGNTYYSIIDSLYEEKFIKSKLGFKIYLKLNKPKKALEAGEYKLSSSMDAKEVLEVLSGGSKSSRDTVEVLFREGMNMRQTIKVITDNFDYISENEIYELLNDDEYIDELINKYWFLTDEIKNDEIYYSLEGYLAPAKYQIYADASIKEIIETLLNHENEVLSKYKDDIENSNYSIHELLSLASVVELEAKNYEDRTGVAGVFMNRLYNNMSLGSDVTTYYAAKVDMGERDLYINEINDVNGYNTRSSSMAGKLPVGPICNPGEESIKASLNPTNDDKFYFVSDKNGKIYFARTYQEHNNIIATLKAENMWYEYE